MNAVGVVFDAVFFIDAAAFVGLAMKTIERRGHLLLARGVGQQVAGDLPEDEVIDPDVAVEGADDPVAPGPEMIEAIRLIPVGVGVTRHVEPVHGHAFAVGGRGEETVHGLLVGIGGCVGEEGIDLGDRGRNPGEIQRRAAEQAFLVRVGGGLELFAFEAGENEAVDFVTRPFGVFHGWQRRGFNREEGPMFLPLRALLHPALEQRDLLRREREMRLGRGHHLLGISRGDAADDFALRRIAGLDHEQAVVERLEGSVRGIEAQLGLAPLFIRPVAGEAAVGEQRLDVVIEVHALRQAGGVRGHRPQHERTRCAGEPPCPHEGRAMDK